MTVNINAQISLVDEEVDEGRPGGEDRSLDAAASKKLLSKRALHDELLHPLTVFGNLLRHRHGAAGLVVYLRVRNECRSRYDSYLFCSIGPL